ncbi:hypothetical protein RIF29_17261 [Crotalaria pallida]|uniref:Uncharacterized protein n=1 Tax=Crotalaria pallida TaxID=3830 RepID=A0AAN9ICT3_CROPI
MKDTYILPSIRHIRSPPPTPIFILTFLTPHLYLFYKQTKQKPHTSSNIYLLCILFPYLSLSLSLSLFLPLRSIALSSPSLPSLKSLFSSFLGLLLHK